MIIKQYISLVDTMYPSFGAMLMKDSMVTVPSWPKWSSMYGYSFGNNTITIDGKIHELEAGQYFSFVIKDTEPKFDCQSILFLACRLGYKCQNTIGWVETKGRLSYIDGCTDSLLVYPPRMGDPSMSLLHFPVGVEQTKHLHPSIRLGCVIDGSGLSECWEDGVKNILSLNKGQMFCLLENEMHNFCTNNSSMTVIAWHPDGDWGPTDHNHTMLNRTYIKQ